MHLYFICIELRTLDLNLCVICNSEQLLIIISAVRTLKGNMKSVGAPKSNSQLLYGSTEQSNINANLPIWKHVTTDNREVGQRQ